MGSLNGRVIAIAGAGGGLGPIVAERLAAEGATLALTDVKEEFLTPVVERLGLDPERIDARPADLLDESATSDWAAALVERFGRVDALLHLVGGWRGGEPLQTASLDDYEWLHDLLVRTLQRTSRAFYEPISTSSSGRFVLISSAQAQDPEGTNAAYGAAKAAAEAWTLALAQSFASAEGVTATANILVVNAILTPQMREEGDGAPDPSFTPAEDIAEAIAWLCSDAAAKMNGKRLPLHP